MKIKVKKSMSEEGIFLVEKKEIKKYIKALGVKTMHVINPNSSLAVSYDYTIENVLKAVDESDRLALLTGTASKNNLGHNLSIVKKDLLLMFNIGEIEKDLEISDMDDKDEKNYFDNLLKIYSKKKIDMCSNDGCYRKRRHGSKYCQKCSDKFKR